MVTQTFWADVSYFQRPVDDTYPHPVLAFRVDTGGSTDTNAAANWAHVNASAKIKVGIGYVVFRQGQRAAILARVKKLFGPNPAAKLVLMIDMESGTEFAGPGNHSSEANGLAQDFATYLGSRQRVIGYANTGDWANNWPSRPSWLKRITASYGSTDPGTWGWQFYGGDARWPSPSGFPRSCKPFGTAVDLNVAHRSLEELLTDLGIEGDLPMDQTAFNKLMDGWAKTPAGKKALAGPMQDLNVGPDGKRRSLETLFRRFKDGNYTPIPKAVK